MTRSEPTRCTIGTLPIFFKHITFLSNVWTLAGHEFRNVVSVPTLLFEWAEDTGDIWGSEVMQTWAEHLREANSCGTWAVLILTPPSLLGRRWLIRLVGTCIAIGDAAWYGVRDDVPTVIWSYIAQVSGMGSFEKMKAHSCLMYATPGSISCATGASSTFVTAARGSWVASTPAGERMDGTEAKATSSAIHAGR